jgi:hypothetical protein
MNYTEDWGVVLEERLKAREQVAAAKEEWEAVLLKERENERRRTEEPWIPFLEETSVEVSIAEAELMMEDPGALREKRAQAQRAAEEEWNKWAGKGRATLLWGLALSVMALVGAVLVLGIVAMAVH